MTGPLPFEEEWPVGLDGAMLFSSIEGLLARLDRVAEHVVGAALGEESRNMTFLISGDWGSGKSSALRYIEDRVTQLLRDRAGIDDCGDPVVFVWYRAPQHVRHSPRASLLYEMVLAIQRYHPNLTATMMHAIQEQQARDSAPRQPPTAFADPAERDYANAMAARLSLASALNGAVDVGPALEVWLEQYLARHGRKLTTVVLIDDLDRCNSGTFVKELLIATQHWGGVANHFFVIGADEGRVRLSLEDSLVDASRADDGGMSKYVHVTVSLPAKIPRRPDAVRLFDGYLERVRHAPTRAALRELLRESPNGSVGVLDPLLGPCTPRELKHRFNGLVGVLDRRPPADESDAATDGADDAPEDPTALRWRVKRAVLQLRWPTEFMQRILPAQLDGDPGQIARLDHLVALGHEALRATGSQAQQAAVVALARASGLELSPDDSLLALYLASDPRPPFTSRTSRSSPGELREPRPRDFRQSKDSVIETPSFQGLAEFANPPGGAQTGILAERVELLRATAELGDEERMRALFEETAPMIEAIEELPPPIATVLGNAALAFAAAGLRREALLLHWSAHRAKPDHRNVAQNFVDYVLDQQVAGLYGVCDEILRRFHAEPGDALRQRLLELRMDLRLGRVGPQDAVLDEIVADATRDGSAIGRTDLIDLLELCRDLHRYDDIPQVASVLLDREADDVREQASTVRIVADTLAASPDPDREEYAAELYRGMMLTGLVRKLGPQGENHTLQNLGSLLNSRSQTTVAAYVFWCALQIEDTVELRARLARTVNRLGFPEAAEDLLSGRPRASRVPPPAAPPFDQPIFPRHEAGQAWFHQHFPLASYDVPLAPEVWQ